MKKILSLGMMLFSAAFSWAQAPYAGVAPADITADGEYFLYNVGTGKWIQNNNGGVTTNRDGWNTAANMGDYGRPFILRADGSNWTLDTQSGPCALGGNTGDANLLYLDGRIGNATWTIEGTAAGVTIKNGDGKYLGVDNAGRNGAAHLYAAADASNNTWQLVTRDERIEKLASATESEPQNVTWMLVNPTLMNNDRMSPQWANTHDGGGDAWNDGYRPNRMWETWSYNSMKCSQTLSVPNGIYQATAKAVYSPTGNNSVNKADYEAYAANGDETVFAGVYANTSVGKLASIYSFTGEGSIRDVTAKVLEGSNVSIVDGLWQMARAMDEDNKFVSQPAVVTVTDGNLEVGIKSLAGNPTSNWVIIGSFELKYLGMPNDLLTPALENLNAAIQAAEAVDQDKLTDAAKTALNNAISEANTYTESTDIDDIANATAALNEVVSDVKDMDAPALKAAIDYMAGREYTDAHAADVYANATKSDDVKNETNALKIRFKQHIADKSVQPTQFTKVTEAVIGEQNNERYFEETSYANGLYIYNVGTGRWFCGGDDWGAHAAIGFPGIKVTLPADDFGSGHYNSIITHLYNGNWGNGGRLNHDGYCDTGGNGWKFYNVDAAKGIVTIARNGNNSGDQAGNGYGTKNLVGFSDNTLMRVDTNKEGAENPNNQWIFVTEAQRDAMAEAAFATASPENPVDLTWKIGMPGFNQRERVEETNQGDETLAWTCNHANYRYNAEDNDSRHAICEREKNHADFCIDIYGDGWNDAFSWTQTITGLEEGFYLVKVQGYNNHGEEANKAKLVAGENSVVLRERSSEDELPWQAYAETTWQAVEYFQNGLYWNEVVAQVGEDGELTIGVTSPNISGNHVVLFDNFRLAYIGQEDPTAITNVAPAKVNGRIYNLQGVEVKTMNKGGIYIQNGKKIMK